MNQSLIVQVGGFSNPIPTSKRARLLGSTLDSFHSKSKSGFYLTCIASRKEPIRYKAPVHLLALKQPHPRADFHRSFEIQKIR